MNSIIDRPLLIIYNNVKDAKWVSIKTAFLIFGINVILAIGGTIIGVQAIIVPLSMCFALLLFLLMGLLMVNSRYRSSKGEVPNLLIPLMQYTWFSNFENVLRVAFNFIFTLYIYSWFMFIGAAIVFFIYSGIAS